MRGLRRLRAGLTSTRAELAAASSAVQQGSRDTAHGLGAHRAAYGVGMAPRLAR